MQSILTGESSSVEKYLESTQSRKAVYQDKTCLLFSVRRTFCTTHDTHLALLNAAVLLHLSVISVTFRCIQLGSSVCNVKNSQFHSSQQQLR